MFKKTSSILLYLASIILLIFSLIYVVINKSDQGNSTNYYKSSKEQSNNLTTITQKEQWKQVSSKYTLLAKKKIGGSFTARTDNLGIIAVPFDTNNKSVNDRIIFRIKQSETTDWYFQATYNTNQIQNNIPFPFGFPIIRNSKNITYTFEIESLNGTPDDSLSLSQASPYFITKYKFTKSELAENPNVLVRFIIAKQEMLTFKEIMSILMFSLFSPIILYLVFKLFKYTFILIKQNDKNIIIKVRQFKDFIYKNNILVLVILLLITILTRFSISYTDISNVMVAPEVKTTPGLIGTDYMGIIHILDLMIHGENMYTIILNLGPGFTLLNVPVVYLLNSLNICSIKDVASCSLVLYHWLLVITLGGYLLLILLISFKEWELLSFLLLYFMIFILDIFGSYGLDRGNIDIILSLISGYLIFWILFKLNKYKKEIIIIFESIIIGATFAFLVSSKFFILPLGLVAIYSSGRMLVAFLSFVATFGLLGYLPDILFGSPSNPLTSINIAIEWVTSNSLHNINFMVSNYSFNALASLATNCVQKQICTDQFDSMVILVISVLLFIFTFIVPFLTTSIIRNKLKYLYKQINLDFIRKINYNSGIVFIKSGVEWLNKQRSNKDFIILLFILSAASLTLLPKYSFPYRLYYTLPLLMLLWKKTKNNKRARLYCLFSIICLSIKGLWILLEVNPGGFNIFEARGMVVFVVLSYYFMIKAGIELVVASAFRRKPYVD